MEEHYGFINRTKNFLDFANLGFILQVNRSIEVGYFFICKLSYCFSFTPMKKCRNLCSTHQNQHHVLPDLKHNHNFKRNIKGYTDNFRRWTFISETAATTTAKTTTTSSTAAIATASTAASSEATATPWRSHYGYVLFELREIRE